MSWAQVVSEQLRDQGRSAAQAARDRANIAAQGQRERGSIWSGAVHDISQIAASIPQQIAQAKAGETQRQLAGVDLAIKKGQLSDQERQRVEQQQLKGIFEKYGGDVDGAIDELMGVNPTLALNLHKQQMEAKESAFKYREQAVKAKQADVGFLGQLAGSATDQNSYTRALYTAQQAGIDISKLPPEFEAAKPQIENLKRAALTASQQLDADLKKIDDERQAATQKEIERHNRAGEQTAITDKTADNARLDKSATETARHNVAMEKAALIRANRPAATGSGIASDDIDAIADGIIAGEQPPTLQGLYRNGAAVRARLANKGFNLAQAETDWKATQRHVNTLNGAQQTRMAQAIDNAAHSLDVIDDLATQWDAGRFPILNRVALAAAKNGASGPKAQALATQLEAQISDVTSELGNVYMGGNSPTDHALGLAAKNLKADWSRDTLRSMVKLARTNLVIRANSMKNVGVAGASAGNPYAQPTAPPTPPRQVVTRDKDGKLVFQKGGK